MNTPKKNVKKPVKPSEQDSKQQKLKKIRTGLKGGSADPCNNGSVA